MTPMPIVDSSPPGEEDEDEDAEEEEEEEEDRKNSIDLEVATKQLVGTLALATPTRAVLIRTT